jgi:putative transcriptional regulator
MSRMIAILLDELLAERGLTFYRLAKETGISHSALWKLRHGELRAMRFDYLDRICRALGCQPGDVLAYRPERGARRGGGASTSTRRR